MFHLPCNFSHVIYTYGLGSLGQALRASVLRIEQYVRNVEDKLADGSIVVKK